MNSLYSSYNKTEDDKIVDTIFFRAKGSSCREHAFSAIPCKLPKCPVNSVKYATFKLFI